MCCHERLTWSLASLQYSGRCSPQMSWLSASRLGTGVARPARQIDSTSPLVMPNAIVAERKAIVEVKVTHRHVARGFDDTAVNVLLAQVRQDRSQERVLHAAQANHTAAHGEGCDLVANHDR